jgi:soluble lytic murein transglycosylase-like protein
MPSLSQRSLLRLAECDPALDAVAREAIKSIDFTVVCGFRGQAEQDAAVSRGTSKRRWPLSKHNAAPSLAMDLAPYANGRIDWDDINAFKRMAQSIKAAAKALNVALTWGGDWKSFKDYPHFELPCPSGWERDAGGAPSRPLLTQPPGEAKFPSAPPPPPEGGLDAPVRAAVERCAQRHGLPVELVAAMVSVESGGNRWAVRYEPGFYDLFVNDNRAVAPAPPCSLDTEKRGRAMSWGLMQVMGEVARELGFSGAFFTELCDPELGVEYGCRLLVRLRKRFMSDLGWSAVVAAYNGGPGAVRGKDDFKNPQYPRKVLAALGGQWPAQ